MRDPAALAESTLSMKIDFNRPTPAGKEFDNIRQAIANAHTAGDGSFTRRCNAWLERGSMLEGLADPLLHRRAWRWRRCFSTFSPATR